MPPMLVPSVTADPSRTPDFQGMAVAPVRNAAPQQIGQLGEAMTRAGSAAFQTGQTMGIQIQNTVDDANVRAAETGFLQQGQGIVTDYTHTLGKNAMDAYDPATQALAKAKQDAMGGLTNDIQRKMFNYVSTQHLMAFGRQMGDHNFQQTVNYRVKEGNDSADAQGQLAATSYSDWQNPDGDYNKHKNNAIAEITAASQLAGIGAGHQLDAAIQQKTSRIADSVLIQMVGHEQYDEARTFYEAALAKHELDEQMQDKWGPAIEQGHKSEKGKNLGDQAVQVAMHASPDQQRIEPIPGGALGAVPTVGEPGRQEPVEGPVTGVMGDPRVGHEHHGIDTAVPVGTPVKAPLDGLVSKVWNDQTGGGLSMEVTYPNGYKEYFMHLSAQNYKEGQKVTQGAILGLSGQSGNATGPVLHDAMKDPNGQWVDPRGVGPALKDPLRFTNPNWLETALQYVRDDPNSDDRIKAIGEAQVLHQYNLAKDVENQKYTAVKNQAVDYYYQHQGSIDGLPAPVRSQLKPEDAYRLSKPIPVETDPETEAGFILNPKTLTVDNVKSAFANGKLSNGSYVSLLGDAVKQAQDPQKVIEATLEADRLKYWADHAGIPAIYTTQSEGQKREYNDLLVRTQQDINQAQIQKGGKLGQDEKDKIMQRNTHQYVVTHLRSAWNPLSWLGQNKYTMGYRGYQIPPGATGTAQGADGKMHFHDAQMNDLGVIPEQEVVIKKP